MAEVRRLDPADRTTWDRLWQGYLEFYEHPLPGSVTDSTFDRLVGDDPDVVGLVAVSDDAVVGIAHLVFHPSTWSRESYCYLEDLFVDPSHRGRGVGRALLDGAEEAARRAGSTKFYWQTHSSNDTARRLYDAVAEHRGFIVYERDL
jgi:GNAT superfamily N-acetyltransferase